LNIFITNFLFDITIKGFINIDHRFIRRAQRWQRNDLNDLWYDTPEDRQISEIYNIEDIFDLEFLFLGFQPYEVKQEPEN